MTFCPSTSAQCCLTSLWSERHAAYVCGLRTFGLSKGLITKKGIAGRFTSLITDLPLLADERAYTDVYEYCTRCGACAVPGESSVRSGYPEKEVRKKHCVIFHKTTQCFFTFWQGESVSGNSLQRGKSMLYFLYIVAVVDFGRSRPKTFFEEVSP